MGMITKPCSKVACPVKTGAFLTDRTQIKPFSVANTRDIPPDRLIEEKAIVKGDGKYYRPGSAQRRPP
jgi:hypothetical protein